MVTFTRIKELTETAWLRYFPFILFAVLFAGCGTESADNTSAETVSPTPTSNSSPQTEQVDAKAEKIDAKLSELSPEAQIYANQVKTQMTVILDEPQTVKGYHGDNFSLLLNQDERIELRRARQYRKQDDVKRLEQEGQANLAEMWKTLEKNGITEIIDVNPETKTQVSLNKDLTLKAVDGKTGEIFVQDVRLETVQANYAEQDIGKKRGF